MNILFKREESTKEVTKVLRYWSYENEENSKWCLNFFLKNIKKDEEKEIQKWFKYLTIFIKGMSDHRLTRFRFSFLSRKFYIIFKRFSNEIIYLKTFLLLIFDLFEELESLNFQLFFITNFRPESNEIDNWIESNSFTPKRFRLIPRKKPTQILE